MWFTKDQIYTPALDVLVRGNRTLIEKEIEEFLIDQFCTLELDELYYTTEDLHEQLNLANIQSRQKLCFKNHNREF